MSHNDAEAVIKIQHFVNFIFIVDEATFLDDVVKLFEVQRVRFQLGNQCLDDLLK